MHKSKAYSARNVQSVEISQVLSGREGHPAQVGVDVSKAELQMVIRWTARSFERPISVDNPSQIPQAVELLSHLNKGRSLIVALEPSGTYGDAFRQAASDAELVVHRVNGKAAHDYAEVFDGVPSQHDGKDAAVIAELAAIGKGEPWPWLIKPEDEQRLAMHADLVDAYERQFTAWSNRVEGWLARHWPEVTEFLKLRSATLLKALAKYGSPAALAADCQAAAQLRLWGGALLKDEKISAVLTSAAGTLGVRSTVVSSEQVQLYATEALSAKTRLYEHRLALGKLSVGKQDIERLAPIIGLVTACVLHARAGDPGQYHCGRAYLKALGLNLAERSSGKQKGQRHVSKRGHAQVRRWLYYAALRLVRQPGVSEWYRRKVERDGGKTRPGLVAVMRKLALAIHRVAKDGVKFDSRRVFDGRRKRKRSRQAAQAVEVAMT